MKRIEKRGTPLRAIAWQSAAAIVLALATFVWMADSAAGAVYDFTYSDTAGDAGYGVLTTTAINGWGDDSQLSISGLLTVTATQDATLLPLGHYPLIELIAPTPGSPPGSLPLGSIAQSGTGNFSIDNLVYPANDAASGDNAGGLSGNPSYLTYDGLLFGTNGVFEINILGNGDVLGNGVGDYGLYTSQPSIPGGYGIQVATGNSFALVPVPEPASVVLFGLGAACLCVLHRRRRKDQIRPRHRAISDSTRDANSFTAAVAS